MEKAFSYKSGQNAWWVAPVYPQADIAYRRIKNFLTPGSFTAFASPFPRIELISGGTIWIKSADNPDCFDSQTEVLTDKGWKFFSNLDKSENVLTLNPSTFIAEWKKPKRYISEEYAGPMFRISSGKLDLFVTPNHRFFVKDSTGKPIGRPFVANPRSKLSAKRQAERQRKLTQRPDDNLSEYHFRTIPELDLSRDKIPARVNWQGNDLDDVSSDLCALLGIYLSEGCSSGAFGGTAALTNGNYTVHFSQTKGIKGGLKGNVRRQMRDLFARLNMRSVKETEDGFYIYSKDLWSQFSKLGNCYSKFIPERTKDLPPEKLRVLLDWLILGDGILRYTKTSTDIPERVYYTTSKQLADDVQEIAIKAGFSAIIREKRQTASVLADGRIITPTVALWQVSILNSEFNYFSNSKESYVSQEEYKGTVHCVETENQTVLVRRNGKPCWSGNSLFGEDVYDVVLDEASRAKPGTWPAIRSTLSATLGNARLIGNVKGRRNFFYNLARLAERGELPGWHYAKITYRDAIDAGVLDAGDIEDARRTMPERDFQELYEAVASDDTANPFGLDHIHECTRPLSQNPVVAWGIDLAKKQDYLVLIGLDKDGAVAALHRWQGVPWRDSIRRIHAIVGEDVPALVDSTGVGDPVLEELQVDHSNFTGYVFSLISKQKIMEGLAVSIQSHEIGFPPGPIRQELETFEYMTTDAGRTTYAAAQGHPDDCVCALALARQVWSEAQPGANLTTWMKSETSRDKTKSNESISVYPAISDFGNFPKREVGIDLDNELTQVYMDTLNALTQPSARICARCGNPVTGPSRVSDGEFIWHETCIIGGFSREVQRRAA